MSTFVLYGRPGWGSAIVEAQLAWYGLPYRLEDAGDLFESEEARARLRPLNPITQVPTLVLPDGQVMTESAAITLHLADITGSDHLVPGPKAPERAAFLRWLVFIVANIYPTFTYGDIPERFVPAGGEAAQGFRAEIDAYVRRLWLAVESQAGTPWVLGGRFSALDLYAAVMTHWRPRRDWFAEHAPRVLAAADAAGALPAVAPVMAANFPPPAAAPTSTSG
ncbi:glutathione S-transferase family protein [Ideonella sp. DXS22W]|uniref:Glutathione S-transferase family protein n=1 Tax=Pseudaquabacterium inlustre TaxID=2984192 RepID=A0ABU9CJX4_9BURK